MHSEWLEKVHMAGQPHSRSSARAICCTSRSRHSAHCTAWLFCTYLSHRDHSFYRIAVELIQYGRLIWAEGHASIWLKRHKGLEHGLHLFVSLHKSKQALENAGIPERPNAAGESNKQSQAVIWLVTAHFRDQQSVCFRNCS